MGLLSGFLRSAPAVNVDDAFARQRAGAFLLDVRERDEFRAVHARGATRITLGQLPQRIDDVPRDRPVLVICRSGGRSARAVSLLRSAGIDAVNVRGGTNAWRAAGLPTQRGGGS